jgi:hypothetical protein
VTKAKLWLLSLAFIGSATALGACGRAHLSSNYAQSYTAWFSAQHVNKKGANAADSKKIIESLDAAEAAGVSKNYRKSTTRSGDESSGSRMLMIAPTRTGGADNYMPPPSVPGQ